MYICSSKHVVSFDILSLANCFSRSVRPLTLFFSRGLFFVAGFHWVSVKGKRATSAEAPILAVAPHSSYMDALPVTFLGLTSVVAKTEAKSIPFFGSMSPIYAIWLGVQML